MTTASIEAAKYRRRKVSVDAVISYMKEVRQSTVHDAAKVLAQRFGAESIDIQESGQFWAEVVSRFGEAAKKGFLDDRETVKSPTGTYRTLYHYLDAKREERLSGPDQLRKELADMKAKYAELQTKYEVACNTIDRLTPKE